MALLAASGALYAGSVMAKPHLQGVAESSLGYTDNAQASARDAGAGARTQSAFWMLSPGAVVALLDPRSLQRLAYRYEYDFYFNSGVSSSSSHRLDYRAFFELSRRLTLVLGANATQSDRFSKVAFAAPAAGVVGALPVGTGSYLAAAADEALGLDISEGFRGWQNASAIAQTPLFGTEAPRTLGAAARLGVERAFLADALGLEGRGDYTVVSDIVDVDGTALGMQRQLSAGGVALWRHDWGRDFTSRVEAGALRVERLNTHRGFWTPVGAATLAYATEQGDATLGYTHTITSNALLGQSLLVDELRLRGSLPLTQKGELSVSGSAGYQRGRLLDENAELATRVRVFLADVAVEWQATHLLEVGARFQHIQQKSGADSPPLPVSFVQNTVLVGATLRFPPEKDMPRPYREPRRVDRSDELRDGLQPNGEGPHVPGNAR